MANETITVELTPEQLEKVKILEENDISVGQAIDLLFEAQEGIASSRLSEAEIRKKQLTSELEEVEKEISLFKKLKDDTINPEEKQRILQKEYTFDDTYDMEVQKAKRNISWAENIFKF